MSQWENPFPGGCQFYLVLSAILVGGAIIEEGTAVDRGPSDLGSVELASWKYFRRDMSKTQRYRIEKILYLSGNVCACEDDLIYVWSMSVHEAPTRVVNHTPHSSQIKLSRMAPNPRNLQKFSPSKVSCYAVVPSLSQLNIKLHARLVSIRCRKYTILKIYSLAV